MTDHTTNEIPYGYCHCGCGQLAPLAKRNRIARGQVKGEPIRFIHGHYGHTMSFGSCEESFWAKVEAGDITECWIWQGSLDAYGYGMATFKQKTYKAHRLSYELHFGSIPDGMYVCHNCPDGKDNPRCVNPAHLFLGTAADNSADMVRKSRQSRGEAKPNARFTESQVIEMRALYGQGMTITGLGERYGVGVTTIHHIVHFNTWKHVAQFPK